MNEKTEKTEIPPIPDKPDRCPYCGFSGDVLMGGDIGDDEVPVFNDEDECCQCGAPWWLSEVVWCREFEKYIDDEMTKHGGRVSIVFENEEQLARGVEKVKDWAKAQRQPDQVTGFMVPVSTKLGMTVSEFSDVITEIEARGYDEVEEIETGGSEDDDG